MKKKSLDKHLIVAINCQKIPTPRFLLYFFNTASELLSNIVSVFFEVATNSQNWLPRARAPRFLQRPKLREEKNS